MRKKVLSIILSVCIISVSLVSSAVPVYASSSVSWSDIYEITTVDGMPKLQFKNDTAKAKYNGLTKKQKRTVDVAGFAQLQKNEASKVGYGSDIFENTTIGDVIKSIVGASGMSIGDLVSADVTNRLNMLNKASDSIHETNLKFGGKGMSFNLPTSGAVSAGLGSVTLNKNFMYTLRANVRHFNGFMVIPELPMEQNYLPSLFGNYEITSWCKSMLNSYYLGSYGTDPGSLITYSPDGKGFYLYKFTFNHTGQYDYYWKIDGSLWFRRRSDGNVFEANIWGAEYIYYSDSLDMITCKGDTVSVENNIDKEKIFGTLGASTIVYDSYSAMMNCIGYKGGTTQSNYYVSNNTINNDYTTTINKLYDYSSHDTYTTINNNITEAIDKKGSELTDEEYQKIVDDVMSKLQTEIDSKEDTDDSGGDTGGDTGGGTGGDSGDTGGGGSDVGNDWLEKIYNRLGDILEKMGQVTGITELTDYIKQIADDVSVIKNGGTVADMTDTNEYLKDIKGLLKTLIAAQVAGDVADLLADTVGDKISEYVDNVKSAATEVTDALQDVFPFSIPWDLLAILALFSAEAKAPVFDIPIHLGKFAEQNIHIDLSEFESVSVICRAFLSISFAVGLMYLTIRITGGGKDDD